MKEYAICTAHGNDAKSAAAKLVNEVAVAIASGWDPLGGISTCPGQVDGRFQVFLHQAIIRETQ